MWGWSEILITAGLGVVFIYGSPKFLELFRKNTVKAIKEGKGFKNEVKEAFNDDGKETKTNK